MNRKLLNGLLVVAIAAGGVGTFTSCKDENYGNEVALKTSTLEAQLAAIRNVTDEDFQNKLQAWLDGMTDTYSDAGFANYYELCQAADDMYKLYNTILGLKEGDALPAELEGLASVLYDWMFDNEISKSEWYNWIQALKDYMDVVNERPSSIEVSHVFNPVFGTINLPVGINSTVLATYMYKAVNSFNFPADAYKNLADASPLVPSSDFAEVISTLAAKAEGAEMLDGVYFTEPDGTFGNMGGAVVAFNPSSLDLTNGDYTVELVNSKGDVVLTSETGDLALGEFDDLLTFGGSRAGNEGIYALQVNACEDDIDALGFEIENKSDIKNAVKEAWNNKTLSDIAHVGEMVFDAVNNKLPAYAVKVSWTEEEPSVVEQEDGSYAVETTEKVNSIYTPFNLAATIVHPLSYNTGINNFIPSDKSLPIIHNPLTYYLDKINNKLTLDFDDIEGIDEDQVDFDLKVGIENGKVYAYDEAGNVIGTFDYTWEGVQPSDKDLNEFVNAVLEAVSAELTDQVKKQIVDKINDAIDAINDQLANVQGKLDDLKKIVNDIKDSRKLTYAQKLVDIYNELAKKANDFLANPEHYLQVMMAYSTGNGAHHVSNDVYMPSTITGSGDGFELITSSYTGDVVVPSYKKYVAITGVYNNGVQDKTANLETLNSAAGLNKVYSGHDQRVAMTVTDALKNKTLQLTYVSVDYRGKCSMENYYIYIK